MPRFTFLQLLAIVTLCCVTFSVLPFAVAGQKWALAMSIVVGTLVLSLVAYAMFFLAAHIVAQLVGVLRPKKPAGSPFAQDTPPPRLVRPVDLE